MDSDAFGISYTLGVDGIERRPRAADDAPQRRRDRLLVRADPGEGQGLLHHDAAAHGRDARRLRRPRPVPLLRVLGGQPLPDVLRHRDLGRPASDLRDREVRHLHPGRVAAHARRDPRRRDRPCLGRQRLHVQLRDAARLRLHRHAPGAGFRRLLPRFCDQGADVAAAHLAARCARRGADRRDRSSWPASC